MHIRLICTTVICVLWSISDSGYHTGRDIEVCLRSSISPEWNRRHTIISIRSWSANNSCGCVRKANKINAIFPTIQYSALTEIDIRGTDNWKHDIRSSLSFVDVNRFIITGSYQQRTVRGEVYSIDSLCLPQVSISRPPCSYVFPKHFCKAELIDKVVV